MPQDKALVTYLTSAFPEKNFTIDLALSLQQNGADIIELGVPFSDPVADGPVIEAANHKALQGGYTHDDLFSISEAITSKIPTYWMGYLNPFYHLGLEAMAKKAHDLGVKGFILPDLPYEESLRYEALFKEHALHNIAFAAPTDSAARLKQTLNGAQGFVYLVAYAGITGANKAESLEQIINEVRAATTQPLYVGFGVNEATAKERIKGADGVIVGSALVKELLDESSTYTQKIERCSTIARTIKTIINE